MYSRIDRTEAVAQKSFTGAIALKDAVLGQPSNIRRVAKRFKYGPLYVQVGNTQTTSYASRIDKWIKKIEHATLRLQKVTNTRPV